MKNLKNKDDRVVFGFNVTVIKTIRELIVAPLTKIINLCFKESIFPTCLKEAIVIPIFKKGEKTKISNYRPISLLPIFSKIIEKCMSSQVSVFLEDHSMLNKQQFGFRRGQSTVLAILDLVSYIMEGFESGEHTGTVFCDLSKAFDCVSHELLIKKLSYYNFDPRSIAFLRSYLNNRVQRVVVDGVASAAKKMDIGVPQGSVMGPLLFLLYINNLPNVSTGEHYVLFADDTTITMRETSLQTLITGLGEAQSRAENWFRCNSLVLNNNKTNHALFSLRSAPDCSYSRAPTKFLGVYLDDGLKWDAHIESLARRLNSIVFVLRNLSGVVASGVLRTAYFALFHSLMSYAIVVWGHAPRSRRVFSLQRRALRIVAGLGYREDCKQTFIDLKVLTFPSLYILENLIYIKKNLEEYPTNDQRHSHGTRFAGQLSVPLWRLERCRGGPNYWAVKFYNRLPDELKNLPLAVFRRRVQDLLLRSALYDTEEFFRMF